MARTVSLEVASDGGVIWVKFIWLTVILCFA